MKLLQSLTLLLMIILTQTIQADPSAKKVLVYAGPGASKNSVAHALHTFKALLNDDGYVVETILPRQLIEGGWEQDTALLIMPGGADIPYTRSLDGVGNERIKAYVEKGGSYLGICAGSYYAGSQVEFAVDSPMEVVGKRELAFFPGIVRGPNLAEYDHKTNSGVRAARVQPLPSSASSIAFYNGGGYFVDAHQYPEVQILAIYEEQPENPAIIKCVVGKGVVILSGVHFEYDPALLDGQDPHLQAVIPQLEQSSDSRMELVKSLLSKLGVPFKEKVAGTAEVQP